VVVHHSRSRSVETGAQRLSQQLRNQQVLADLMLMPSAHAVEITTNEVGTSPATLQLRARRYKTDAYDYDYL